MKEMTMLDLDHLDLSALCEALEDHSPDTTWLLDPRTGQIVVRHPDIEDDIDLERLVEIQAIPSREAYRDLVDFTARVRDPRPKEILERAIGGRGAFRRFKDALFEFPDLREAWFQFHDLRMQRRALEWLARVGLADAEAAQRAIDACPDPEPPELSGPFDPEEIARHVAADLRKLYGDRLRRVVLFGSWARGDAHPESDIDLLVVLDRIDSRWSEHIRMDEVLWHHSLNNDTVVTALPVSEDDADRASTPLLVRAGIEGRDIA